MKKMKFTIYIPTPHCSRIPVTICPGNLGDKAKTANPMTLNKKRIQRMLPRWIFPVGENSLKSFSLCFYFPWSVFLGLDKWSILKSILSGSPQDHYIHFQPGIVFRREEVIHGWPGTDFEITYPALSRIRSVIAVFGSMVTVSSSISPK